MADQTIIPFQTENEWLQIRKQGIGGSDAAAVLGYSSWQTPLEVYHEKISDHIDLEESNPAYWGKLLEPVVIREYAKREGKTVLKPEGIIRMKDHPFAQASLDGYTDDGILVEAKTTAYDDNWGHEGTDDIPTEYLIQVQHTMMVTGLKVANVPVLFTARREFRVYRDIEADPDLQAMMLEREAEFWDAVQRRMPPPPKSVADFRITKSIPNPIYCDESLVQTVVELKRIKKDLKDLTEEEKTTKEILQAFMGEHEGLMHGRDLLATWKSIKQKELFDHKRLKEEMPEVYEKYKRLGAPSRMFLVK